MKNYPKNCKTVVSLFLVLCSLFIINCEIDPDYLKKIDNEVAWHNAKKLEVSIAFPPSWGTSNPGQGLIQRNVIDIRLGYTFEIDFTPVTEFSLVGWRAYATEDLTLAKLGINNWLQNLNYLDNEWRKTQEGLEPIDQLSIGEGLDIEISNISHRGGRGTFKININKDVTLIPYCNTEAYIISSEPRDNKQGLWPVMSPIILYFNAPLDPDMTWTLGGEMIKINAKDSEGNYSIPLNNYYETPVYQSRFGLHTVTISPRITNPPGDNLEVEMTIGPNIFNANDPNQEYKMTVDKIYWTTTVRDLPQGSIAAWGAKYENNSITVSWTIDGDGEVKGYWQEGWGSINDLPSNKTIPNIIPVNSENIRQGMSVSGVREYRIKLQLVASDIIIDEKELKIWNVPGMNVSDTVVITEINSPAALAAIPNGATGQYVLTSDITVDNHTPIPNFTGNFYGNGHTITINSFTNSTYTGLFGYVSGNAQIRDLTVRINGNIQAGSNTTHAGGLAGFIGGVEKDDKNNVLAAAKITNCIITGGQLSIITNSTEPVFLGGMTGQIESGVVISNSHVALNIELLSRGDGDVYAGGVAAKIGIGEDPNNDQVYMLIYPIDPDDPDFIFPGLPENIIARHDILFDIQAVGNVSCIKDGDFDGLMFAGGIIGSCVSNGGRLLRLGYGGTLRTGRHSSLVIFSSKFLNIFGGGIAGYVRYPRMELCVFERGGKIEVTQDNSEARFGGIAGLLKEGISASEYSLQTSTSRGDINIVVTGYALVGGICGEIIGSSEQESVRLNDCVYEQGSIYFRTEAHWRNVVGGVIGYLDTFGAITNSYSHAARIETLVSFGGLSLAALPVISKTLL
ncbi:MAG: hypothetical protein FWD13_09760 [Treponema sp.]|nr:hypothetical protein [Treponema sp.]